MSRGHLVFDANIVQTHSLLPRFRTVRNGVPLASVRRERIMRLHAHG